MGLANLFLPALVAWALCGATIAIGRAVTSLRNALIVHAVAAPVIFAFASFVYFRGAHYTTPLQTAIIYVSLVMVLNFVVVAALVQKSYAMFASILGTWIPFASIFASTYIVGVCGKVDRRSLRTAGAGLSFGREAGGRVHVVRPADVGRCSEGGTRAASPD